ncbi:MAG: DNA-formamidopyrimidine glycosylase family protein [Propionibacteriaceae bacterium]|nr:DNA-formamidopyrimidine glycosylase family protein [Propionibacteriaceae bacterium]
MPEGDTVYRLAARLRPVLAGQVLVRTQFRVPSLATRDLSGREVTTVEARGKHLLIGVGDTVVWSHLKMEGHWRVYPAGGRWTSPAHTARCVLATATHEAVGFSLGFLRLLPAAGVESRLAFLGPDPLGDWNPDAARRNLRAQGERALGLALLDQSVIAGLGNVYRSEVLFLSGIHPGTPVSDLSDNQLGRVVEISARLLRLNRDRDRRNTTGNAGGPPSWVYRRAGQPCLRCRTPVARGSLGGSGIEPFERVVFWCPRCQAATG